MRNVQNTDEQCFEHAVVAALYEPENGINPCRVKSYEHAYSDPDCPNFNTLKGPVTLRDIDRFERDNPGISVNVYTTKEWRVRTKKS